MTITNQSFTRFWLRLMMDNPLKKKKKKTINESREKRKKVRRKRKFRKLKKKRGKKKNDEWIWECSFHKQNMKYGNLKAKKRVFFWGGEGWRVEVEKEKGEVEKEKKKNWCEKRGKITREEIKKKSLPGVSSRKEVDLEDLFLILLYLWAICFFFLSSASSPLNQRKKSNNLFSLFPYKGNTTIRFKKKKNNS